MVSHRSVARQVHTFKLPRSAQSGQGATLISCERRGTRHRASPEADLEQPRRSIKPRPMRKTGRLSPPRQIAPAQLRIGSYFWGWALPGALGLSLAALVNCGGSAPEPTAQPPAPASAAAAPSGNDSPGAAEAGLEPGAALTPEPASVGCSEPCKILIGEYNQSAAKASGLAGTAGEQALSVKAAAQGERAWRGCLLRQPDPPDGACPGAGDLVSRWVASAASAKDPDLELVAQLVLRDPRWRPQGATVDDTRLQALMKQVKQPELALAAQVALRDPRKVLGRVSAIKATGKESALAQEVLIGAADYFNQSDMAREALSVLPKAGGTLTLQTVWLGQQALALWRSGQHAAALKQADKLTQGWAAADEASRRSALARKAPHPLIGRESIVAALGIAKYLQAENLRVTAEKLKAPSTAALKDSKQLKAYFEGPFAAWLRQRQAALDEATEAYRDIAAVEPVPPLGWVAEGARRVGELWQQFSTEITQLKLPAALDKDKASVDNFRKALVQSVRPLSQRARASFEVCAGLASKEPVGAGTREACEQALK